MHPIPGQIVPPPVGDTGGDSATGAPRPVQLDRDALAVTARCPHCRGQLELSAVGTRWQARRPSDVADRLIAQLGSLEREELHVLLLDTRCGVMAQERVYQGNVSSSLVRVGELFTAAVRRNATAILLVHSHPSGDPTPSPDDLRLTAEAVAAGRLLDIALLDHLIIAGSAYVSLRERGVAFGDPGDHHARPSWPTESAAPARLRLENGGQQ